MNVSIGDSETSVRSVPDTDTHIAIENGPNGPNPLAVSRTLLTEVSGESYREGQPLPFDPGTDGWPKGPDRLVLLGPPGTGKTRAVLTHWLLPALQAHKRALVCSFTRAAAGEVRKRLGLELDRTANEFAGVATTIHAEALRLIRREHGRNLKLVGERRGAAIEDADRLVRPAGRDLRSVALRCWDLARSRSVALGDVLDRRPRGFSRGEIQAYVEVYEEKKAETGKVDFADLLAMALEIDPPERDLLIVDEAQDLAEAQWRLVERWADNAERVILVGDPDQAVHEWAGAEAHRLAELAERDGFALRRLARSFRVPAAAHSLARGVITRNRKRIDAPYDPATRPGVLWEPPRDGDVIELLDDCASAGRSAFLLARTGKALTSWVSWLSDRAVPFANERGASPLGSVKGTAAARAVLALRAGRGAEPVDAVELVRQLPARTAGPFFRGKKKDAVKAVREWAKRASDTSTLTPALASTYFGVDLERLCDAGESLLSALRLLGLAQRAVSLDRLVARHGEEVLERKPCVTLTTMHAAKGREADVVVVDMLAPRSVRRELWNRDVLEAERRILYVALTRTKDELVLVRRRRDLGYELDMPRVSRVVRRTAMGGQEQLRTSA